MRKTHWLRNLGIAVLIVAVALGAYVALTFRPQMIAFYRLVNDNTIVVQAEAGALIWPHLSGLQETPTEVRITVSGISLDVPSIEQLYDVTVVLAAPLGDRAVIDASTGEPVFLQHDLVEQ